MSIIYGSRESFGLRYLENELPQISIDSLKLDSQIASFTQQATHPISLATFTTAGFMGKLSRLSILSMIPNAVKFSGISPLLSHAVSIGVEAGTFVVMNRGMAPCRELEQGGSNLFSEFFLNFINFSAYRFLASQGPCGQPALFFGTQVAGMMMGHQLAAAFGLEKKSQLSVVEQVFDTSLSVLQIQLGSFFVGRMSGGKLHLLEQAMERLASARQSIAFHSVLSQSQSFPLLRNVGEDLWSPRMRGLMERVNDRSFSYEDNTNGIFNFEFAESFQEGSSIELLHDVNGERLVWIESEPAFRRLHYRNSEGSEVKIKNICTFFSESKKIEDEAITPSPTYLHPHTSFGGLNSTMIELELKTEDQFYKVRYFFLGKIPEALCETRVMQRGMFKVPEHPAPQRIEFGELAEFEHEYAPVQPLSEFLDDRLEVFEARLLDAQKRVEEPMRRRTALVHAVRFEASHFDGEPPLLFLTEAFVEEPYWMRQNCLRLVIIAIEIAREGAAFSYNLQAERGKSLENFRLRVRPVDVDFFQFEEGKSFYLAAPFHFGYTSLSESQRDILLLRKISYVEFMERAKRIYKVVDKKLIGLDYHLTLQAFEAGSDRATPHFRKIYLISHDLYHMRLADVVNVGNYLEVLNDEPVCVLNDGP